MNRKVIGFTEKPAAASQAKDIPKLGPAEAYFVQHGNRFVLTSERESKVHDVLPKGVYEVIESPLGGYYLVAQEERELPSKLYGTLVERGQRILNTYYERAKLGLPTGVLLSGEKGSGKTLLARYLMKAIDLPTVIVSKPYTAPDFLTLLVSGGAKLVLFDEFEKVYNDEAKQNGLLSMLDGHHATVNLTIATLNNRYALAEAVKNRPSRFYYHYRYDSLEKQFIEEYCNDRLKNTSKESMFSIMDVATRIAGFNFDMLQVMVEEMNRYGDTAEECIKHINVYPNESGIKYKVQLINLDGEERRKLLTPTVKPGAYNPKEMNFYIRIEEPDTDEEAKPGDMVTQTIYVSGDTDHAETLEDGSIVFDKPHDEVRIILRSGLKNMNWAL